LLVSGSGGLAGAKVGKIEEVGAVSQVAEQELGEGVWLEVDSC
jgi:hypothetical protein